MSSSEQDKTQFPFVLQGSCVPRKLKKNIPGYLNSAQNKRKGKHIFCGLYVKRCKHQGSDHCEPVLWSLNAW